MSFPTFDVDNKQIFRLDGNVGILDGNVGIGTSDPEIQLHTYVDTGNSHFMQQSNSNKMSIITNDSSNPHPYTTIRPENMGTDKMLMIGNGTRVGSGNNNYSWNKVIFDSPTLVGIGITDPSGALDVSGTIISRGKIGIGTNDPAKKLHIYNSDGGGTLQLESANTMMYFGSNDNIDAYVWVNTDDDLKFGTNNTERIRIKNGGNVGIGTNNPSGALDVSGNIILRGKIGIGTTNPSGALDVSGTIRGAYNRDTTSYFGRAAIGYAGSGLSYWASFAHIDCNNTNDYALIQNSAGRTKLNAKSLQKIQFTIGNVEKMVIDASGNVGIGTTNPEYKLHIYATAIRPDYNSEILQQAGSNKMSIFTNDSYTTIRPEDMTSDKLLMIGNGTRVGSGNNNYSWNKVIFDSPTLVGIGTDNPQGKMEIEYNQSAFTTGQGIDDIDGTLVLSNTHANSATSGAYGANIKFAQRWTSSTSDSGHVRPVEVGAITGYQNAHGNFGGGLTFWTHPTGDNAMLERMRIRNNGNVGIGATIPYAKLQIDHSGNEIGDFTGIRISNHAQYLHGTTRPAYEFIVSDINASTGLGNAKFAIGYRGTTSASRTNRLVIDKAGNIGIGTNNPRYPLEVIGGEDKHGTGSYGYTFYNSGSHRFNSTTTIRPISIYANESIWSAVMVMASSDERIKSNIQDIQDDAALQTLRSIQPKTYNYKDVVSRGNSTVYGFIAQQIKEVLPDAVSLESTSIPNIYENTEVSTVNGIYNTISFTNFDTADLDASSNTIVVKDLQNKDHTVNISEIIDNKTIRVDTDLSEWMGAVDASNETVIANEVQTYEKVILDASNNVVLENYDVSQIATLDASENVVGKTVDLSDDNTIDSSNNYVDASGNFIAGPINTNGHYIDASGNYFDASGNFKDASNNLIGTYKAEWKNVIVHGTKIFVYGQTVNDFHTLNKSAIWTVATAALQEVDRQLQSEKAKVSVLESDLTAEKAKTATLESQMADLLTRVSALEST